MPQIELRPIDRRNRASLWLSDRVRTVTSQVGQDGIIEAIFEKIGLTNKACCEFGAWDGKHLSNTWNLIANNGWDGYLIEGSADRCKQISQNHNNNPKVHVINAWVGFEPGETIDDLLESAGAPRDLDFISIDVDGNDWHVWHSMKRYRPRVVEIEYNPTISNEVYFVQDQDFAIHQGCSPLALIDLGKKMGYEVVSLHGDAFFVREDLFPLMDIPNNHIDALRTSGVRELRIWQGYDGKFWTAGTRVAGWQARRAFEPDTLQVLASEEMTFGSYSTDKTAQSDDQPSAADSPGTT